MFPIQFAQYLEYCGNLIKVFGATLFNTDYSILVVTLQSCWANFPTPHSLS